MIFRLVGIRVFSQHMLVGIISMSTNSNEIDLRLSMNKQLKKLIVLIRMNN